MKSLLEKFIELEKHSKQMEFISSLEEEKLRWFCNEYFEHEYLVKMYNENNTYEFLRNKINELRKENENLMKENENLKNS